MKKPTQHPVGACQLQQEEVGRRGAESGETVGAAQPAVPCQASRVKPVEGRGRAARRCGAVSDIAVSLHQHV